MIYVGDKRATIYHGDYHPAALYKGDQMIAGWQDHPMSGAGWSAEGTYNDALPLEILGKSHQENYHVGVLDGEIVQFEDGENGTEMIVAAPEDCTVTRCGRNLFNQSLEQGTFNGSGTSDEDYSATRVRTSGFITVKKGFYIITSNKQTVVNKYFPNLGYRANDGYKDSPFIFEVFVDDIIRTAFKNSNDSPINVADVKNIQLAIGTTAYPYEPYTGQTYTIPANTPTKIPLLDGCNTVFADAGNLHVEYRKASTAVASSTDIIAPTPDWPSTIKSSGGSNVIVAGNAGKSLTIPLPEGFGGLPNAQDRLYLQDGKCWWEKNTAEVVLDGSEYWTGFAQSNTYGVLTSKVSIKKGTGISNKLKNATIGNQLNTVRLNVDNRIYCYVSQNFTSESKWKAQLSQWNLEGVPLMVRYELATPETIDITDTPTGQAMLAARTYPHFTRVYSDADENLKPTISATIKEVAL